MFWTHGIHVANGWEDSGKYRAFVIEKKQKQILLLDEGGYVHPFTRALQVIHFAENVLVCTKVTLLHIEYEAVTWKKTVY